MQGPKISICITTYNRTTYLPRLLDSIAAQTYKNYNIIVTDNSDTDVIERFLQPYAAKMPISYYKNNPMLNMAGNWNKSFSIADGEWIKLIHDDDWLATETALQEFVNATDKGVRFIFSGRNDFYENTGEYVSKTISQEDFKRVSKNPHLLFEHNILGPPSIVMFQSNVKQYYDVNLKWFVDLEYYLTMMDKEPALYIDKPLLNTSYNDTQMTNSCFNNPAVVIPEALYILKKHGLGFINDIMVYDSFWRMIRNLKIKNPTVLEEHSAGNPVPDFLYSIVKHQQPFSYKTLRKGYISKPLMALSYLLNKKKIAAAS